MASKLPVFTWDYDFSPYGQKIRTLLKAAAVPFAAVDQPVTLPRPDLTGLGITYRRIPLLAIGRDVYCDTAAIVNAVQRLYGGRLPTTKADKAFELYGSNVFQSCLTVISPSLLEPAFIKDRETIFPILGSPRFADLRPSGLAELQSHMREIEEHILGDDPFVGGQHLALADIHVVFSIRWLLFTLEMNKQPGYGPNAFPKLYKWIERLPSVDVEKVEAEKAIATILHAPYVEDTLQFDEKDPLGIAKGSKVDIENADTTLGAHPQSGRLEGLTKDEVVLQLDNGLRLHFPRTGYYVFKAK